MRGPPPEMGSQLLAYLAWIPAVAVMLLVPGLLLWGLSRLMRKVEAGGLFSIFVGILCVAAGAAIFYGLSASALLESPGKVLDQNLYFWLRVGGYIVLVTLLVYYLLGLGIWLWSPSVSAL